VKQALALQPDVLFFDIRMPGQTGLEAAAELADAWPAQGPQPFPALVFVTAYDQYAVAAFDAQAVDYLLKPVQRARLAQTTRQVQQALQARQTRPPQSGPNPHALHAPSDTQLAQLAALLAQIQASAHGQPQPQTHGQPQGQPGHAQAAPGSAPHGQPPHASGSASLSPPLTVIQASASTQQGAALVMVPVDEVLYFEAADKYVRVLTAEREVLIRTPLKDLLPQLNPQHFWQVHRGTVVRVQCIEHVHRDEAGKLWLHLRQRPERLAVSRLYSHLFKAM
jgi:DNA-binding LytR/AlgR family response regulator